MTASDLDQALAETIARHVVDVPGVAFLRPGLVDALRAAARAGVRSTMITAACGSAERPSPRPTPP
jgi:hypothetical protein